MTATVIARNSTSVPGKGGATRDFLHAVKRIDSFALFVANFPPFSSIRSAALKEEFERLIPYQPEKFLEGPKLIAGNGILRVRSTMGCIYTFEREDAPELAVLFCRDPNDHLSVSLSQKRRRHQKIHRDVGFPG